MRAREQFTDMFWLMKKSHPQLHKIMDELHARAKEGDAEAQFSLAEKYHTFADSEFVDQSKALEFFSKSAMQGHKEALKQLRMYAEKMKEFAAQYYLGIIYKHGNGVLIDKFEAAKWFISAAELDQHGHTNAWFEAGIVYHLGNGVSKNPKEATKWFYKAAGRGNEEAFEYLKKYAEQGLVEAQYNVASLYKDDYFRRSKITHRVRLQDVMDGVNRTVEDDKEVVKWSIKAAEQGHIQAQLDLIDMYRDGIYVSKNSKEEAKWLFKAASKGNERALSLLHIAADKAVHEAQYNLGIMYANGEAVLKDLRKAKDLLGKAHGSNDSKMKEKSKQAYDEYELWKY
jgi:TPR repeat protein